MRAAGCGRFAGSPPREQRPAAAREVSGERRGRAALPFVRSSPRGSEGAARGRRGGERGFRGDVSRPFYLVAAGKEGGREAAAVTAGLAVRRGGAG